MWLKFLDTLTSSRFARTLAVSASLLFVALFGLTYIHWQRQSSRGHQHYVRSRESRHGLSRLDDATLSRLCEESQRHLVASSYSRWDLERNDPGAWREVERGIKRTEVLLPIAKRMTLESLRHLAADFRIPADELRQAEGYINRIEKVVLDRELGNSAEVSEDFPAEIHIGPSFALDLTTDEDVALLLGHELTHVATWGEGLSQFIDSVAQGAQRAAGVYPTSAQREDLACDFIGEQVAKRFIRSHPTDEPAGQRFARLLDYNCGSYSDEDSDEEHMSQSETLRALLGLDAELGRLILKP